MSTNGSNRKSASNSADVNSSRLIDPASVTELDPSSLMEEANFEGDGLADVEFKPGADFEVDDSLFQVCCTSLCISISCFHDFLVRIVSL